MSTETKILSFSYACLLIKDCWSIEKNVITQIFFHTNKQKYLQIPLYHEPILQKNEQYNDYQSIRLLQNIGENLMRTFPNDYVLYRLDLHRSLILLLRCVVDLYKSKYIAYKVMNRSQIEISRLYSSSAHNTSVLNELNRRIVTC